jgi:threonylcarbamoyladenosine tRNA methylthiotransferase MtaB
MRCAFCVVPSVRGRQRSRPLPEVVEEVARLAAGGFQEVVVTGVQISAYRWNGARLYELIEALLGRTPVRRLRLSSIAPWQVDGRLLALADGYRVCRHFHLSLQSGSTTTLKRMRRPYTAPQYAAVVERIRQAVPGVAVTSDVIAGFPGETEEEFAESLAFVDRLGLTRIHAFPFSPRPGTEAAELPDQVPHAVKRRRMAALLELAGRSERSFVEQRLGEEVGVLWERRRKGVWHGITDHYLGVSCPAGELPRGDLAGRLTWARLAGLPERGAVARVEPLGGAGSPSALAARAGDGDEALV